MSQADAFDDEETARPLKKKTKPQRQQVLAVSSTSDSSRPPSAVPVMQACDPQKRKRDQQDPPPNHQLPTGDEPQPLRNNKQSKKAQILQQLPTCYRSKLGSIGFCKWGKRHHPAVIMSPFQLPKKSLARKAWKELFLEKRPEGPEKLREMSFLVYWYGEPNLELCYNLVPQRDFVLYENADSKMLAYCRKAHLKQSQNLPLSKAEERRLTAMEELQADLERLQQQQSLNQPEPCVPSDATLHQKPEAEMPKGKGRPSPTKTLERTADSDTPSRETDERKEPTHQKSSKPHKKAPPPLLREENNGMGTPQQLKKRPRGRPPLGKVWDPIHGEYVPEGNAAISDLKEPPREEKSPTKNSPTEKHNPPATPHVSISCPPTGTPAAAVDKMKSPSRSRSDSISRKSKKKKRKRTDSMSKSPMKPKSTLKSPKENNKVGTKMTKEQKKIQLMEKMLEKAQKDAKAELKRETAEVMTKLPTSVHDKFGLVGFARWGKVYLPALVLNPYRVPPGPVRDVWLSRFREYIMQGDDLSSIHLLVFWYGELDVNNFYSMVPSSAFVPYGQATDKMLDYAAKAESKRSAGKHLTHDDQQRLRAMQELEEDLQKLAADRKRGVVVFQERHELLTLSDMEDIDCDTDDEGDLESVYDDGYSSLEDSEDDLNDDRECLSSSSSDEDDADDGVDESDEEFETKKEPKSAILDDSSDEDCKKSARKKSKKKGKNKRVETPPELVEGSKDPKALEAPPHLPASPPLGSSKQVSSADADANVDSNDTGDGVDEAAKKRASETSSMGRIDEPPSPPPAKKAKSAEVGAAAAAPPQQQQEEEEEGRPSNHASKVIPDDESGVMDSDDEGDIADEQRSKSKVPRRVYVEEEEEQSELQYSDAGAFTEDEPSEVASAPRSAVLGVARAAFAQAQAAGTTASLAHPANALAAMATAAGLPSNCWEQLKPIMPDLAQSEGASGGQGEKHPVFAMFNQIVQQVCQERDSALQKVSTLQALLEEKQEREQKTVAAAAAQPTPTSSNAEEDTKQPASLLNIPPPDQLGKKKRRKKKRRRDDEEQGGEDNSGGGPQNENEKSTT